MDKNTMLTAALGMVLAAMVLLSPAACVANRHNQIAQAIKAGADPIEAKCAIEGNDGPTTTLCVLAAMKLADKVKAQ